MPKRKLSAFEGSGQTVTIKLADVPEYLPNGELFRSMQSESSAAEEDEALDDADQVEVHVNCVKLDQTVNSVDDAWSLLHSLRYWIVGTELPPSLVAFCVGPGGKGLPTSFWATFAPQFPSLHVVKQMVTSRAKDPSAKVRMAIATGDVSLVRLVHETLQCNLPS
jgi:hypothetical protein